MRLFIVFVLFVFVLFVFVLFVFVLFVFVLFVFVLFVIFVVEVCLRSGVSFRSLGRSKDFLFPASCFLFFRFFVFFYFIPFFFSRFDLALFLFGSFAAFE